MKLGEVANCSKLQGLCGGKLRSIIFDISNHNPNRFITVLLYVHRPRQYTQEPGTNCSKHITRYVIHVNVIHSDLQVFILKRHLVVARMFAE